MVKYKEREQNYNPRMNWKLHLKLNFFWKFSFGDLKLQNGYQTYHTGGQKKGQYIRLLNDFLLLGLWNQVIFLSALTFN